MIGGGPFLDERILEVATGFVGSSVGLAFLGGEFFGDDLAAFVHCLGLDLTLLSRVLFEAWNSSGSGALVFVVSACGMSERAWISSTPVFPFPFDCQGSVSFICISTCGCFCSCGCDGCVCMELISVRSPLYAGWLDFGIFLSALLFLIGSMLLLGRTLSAFFFPLFFVFPLVLDTFNLWPGSGLCATEDDGTSFSTEVEIERTRSLLMTFVTTINNNEHRIRSTEKKTARSLVGDSLSGLAGVLGVADSLLQPPPSLPSDLS